MDADDEAKVRRSSIAPCVTCGLCGGILRDATTISECLHSFCRKCVYEKLEDEDNKHCPTCTADLGCYPKLRPDHILQCISSVIFPAKRRKMEEISSLHSGLVSLPALPSRANRAYNSAKKMDACLLFVSMDADTLSSEVEITAERTVLPHAASGGEVQKVGNSGNLEKDLLPPFSQDIQNVIHIKKPTLPGTSFELLREVDPDIKSMAPSSQLEQNSTTQLDNEQSPCSSNVHVNIEKPRLPRDSGEFQQEALRSQERSPIVKGNTSVETMPSSSSCDAALQGSITKPLSKHVTEYHTTVVQRQSYREISRSPHNSDGERPCDDSTSDLPSKDPRHEELSMHAAVNPDIDRNSDALQTNASKPELVTTQDTTMISQPHSSGTHLSTLRHESGERVNQHLDDVSTRIQPVDKDHVYEELTLQAASALLSISCNGDIQGGKSETNHPSGNTTEHTMVFEQRNVDRSHLEVTSANKVNQALHDSSIQENDAVNGGPNAQIAPRSQACNIILHDKISEADYLSDENTGKNTTDVQKCGSSASVPSSAQDGDGKGATKISNKGSFRDTSEVVAAAERAEHGGAGAAFRIVDQSGSPAAIEGPPPPPLRRSTRTRTQPVVTPTAPASTARSGRKRTCEEPQRQQQPRQRQTRPGDRRRGQRALTPIQQQWNPEQREHFLGEDEALRQADIQAGLEGIQMALGSDDLPADDSSDEEFVIPDVTPFRRTHNDEAGGSGSAAPQATQASPASQAQPTVPDLNTQMAELRRIEDTSRQMLQASLVRQQEAEERFRAHHEQIQRLLYTQQQQLRWLEFYISQQTGLPAPPPLPVPTVPLAQLQSPLVTQPICPMATPGAVSQIPLSATSVPHSPALPDISTSFRTPTSALFGQYGTTSTLAAFASLPASTGGLAESSVSLLARVYLQLAHRHGYSATAPLGYIDSAL